VPPLKTAAQASAYVDIPDTHSAAGITRGPPPEFTDSRAVHFYGKWSSADQMIM
jgi:hypothetical protein